jgi:hypothetical protein
MEILEHTESTTIRGDGLSGSDGKGKSIAITKLGLASHPRESAMAFASVAP